MRRSDGFSLMELLIALAIFSVLVMLSYRSVDLLLDAQASNGERHRVLQQWQRALVLLERDLHQVVQREQNSGYGTFLPALDVPDNALLALTRGGNPDLGWELRNGGQGQMRSYLQRVEYVLEDGKLLRRSWDWVDHAESTEPVELVLLAADVAEVGFRFMDDKKTWQSAGDWSSRVLPKAIELTLRHEKLGEIKRVFVIYL